MQLQAFGGLIEMNLDLTGDRGGVFQSGNHISFHIQVYFGSICLFACFLILQIITINALHQPVNLIR